MTRAILLVDHGSRRSEAGEQLEAIAELLRERCPDAIVRTSHLEINPPGIGEAIDACVAEGVDRIIVHPYFLAAGAHATRDIPEQLTAAAARHPGVAIHLSDPLGVHPKLVDVIVDRLASARPL